MAQNTDKLLEQAQAAIAVQGWREAWAFIDKIDQQQLGSRLQDMYLLAATCLRHQGRLSQAEELYRLLTRQLSLKDPRLTDAIVGLAEVAHLHGDFDTAKKLATAAERMPVGDARLDIRIQTSVAHIWSHINVDESVARFERLLAKYPVEESTLWAHVLFNYADTLLVAGEYDQAQKMFIRSYQLAVASGASITAADSMRRLPLARILLGQVDYALRSMGDLAQANELYEIAGDRGSCYLHTEAGEVYRAIGKWNEAARSFKAGLWAAREIHDSNRIAHNQLGLFELSRATGAPNWQAWEDALNHYKSIKSEWGVLHCIISRALAAPEERAELLEKAYAMIDRSSFSRFPRERELLERLEGQHDDDPSAVSREPHLMNYP